LGVGLVCGIGWKKEGFGGLNACFVCIFGQALKGQREEVYPTGPVSEEDEWEGPGCSNDVILHPIVYI
jgi:hypothetical protein